jgi:hypothetical protein
MTPPASPSGNAVTRSTKDLTKAAVSGWLGIPQSAGLIVGGLIVTVAVSGGRCARMTSDGSTAVTSKSAGS